MDYMEMYVEPASLKFALCSVCNSTSKDVSRNLCPQCLNKNLQRACLKNVVPAGVSPTKKLCSSRVLFPGMPRAVIGPMVEKRPLKATALPLPLVRTTTSPEAHYFGVLAEARPHGTDVRAESNGVPDKDVLTSTGSSPKEKRYEVKEKCDEVRIAVDTHCKIGASIAGIGDGRSSQDCSVKVKAEDIVSGPKHAEAREPCANDSSDKWGLFQAVKHLTVKILSPTDSMRKVCAQLPVESKRKSDRVSLPVKKEIRARYALRPPRFKDRSIRSDANAEADLMMRLLSDSVPMLKSRASLVLPICEVRPVQISPPLSPGDPLWKRRSIACPLSLRVQVPLVRAK